MAYDMRSDGQKKNKNNYISKKQSLMFLNSYHISRIIFRYKV